MTSYLQLATVFALLAVFHLSRLPSCPIYFHHFFSLLFFLTSMLQLPFYLVRLESPLVRLRLHGYLNVVGVRQPPSYPCGGRRRVLTHIEDDAACEIAWSITALWRCSSRPSHNNTSFGYQKETSRLGLGYRNRSWALLLVHPSTPPIYLPCLFPNSYIHVLYCLSLSLF